MAIHQRILENMKSTTLVVIIVVCAYLIHRITAQGACATTQCRSSATYGTAVPGCFIAADNTSCMNSGIGYSYHPSYQSCSTHVSTTVRAGCWCSTTGCNQHIGYDDCMQMANSVDCSGYTIWQGIADPNTCRTHTCST